MNKYRLVAKKGEGTFSEVLKAQSVISGRFFAVKCMKNHFKSQEQVNNLREIQALRLLHKHENIISLEEVLFDADSGRLALVFELMDMNIYELIRNRKHYLKADLVKSLMYQLMRAVAHMHKNCIFHRDIKPENILIQGEVLKIADLGSCRGTHTSQPFTEYISTRWYRAPECLLTNGYYDSRMDLWGVGCVMFEIVSLFPLFPGSNELDQIEKIHKILGTPSADILAKFQPHTSNILNKDAFQKQAGQEPTGIKKLISHVEDLDQIDLIEQLVQYDPDDRLEAEVALSHPYFGGKYQERSASPKQERERKHKRDKRDKRLPNVGKSKKDKEKKSTRRRKSQGISKRQSVVSSEDEDEDGTFNDSGSDSDHRSESSDNEPSKRTEKVKRQMKESMNASKDLMSSSKGESLLPPHATKTKNRNKKNQGKKGFNSSATNLPTIHQTAGTLNMKHAGGGGNHLSLNIRGYKHDTKTSTKSGAVKYSMGKPKQNFSNFSTRTGVKKNLYPAQLAGLGVKNTKSKHK